MVYGDMLFTNYEPGKSIEHGVSVGTRWLPATANDHLVMFFQFRQGLRDLSSSSEGRQTRLLLELLYTANQFEVDLKIWLRLVS